MAAFSYAEVISGAAPATWGPGVASCRLTAPVNSDLRQLEASTNYLLWGLNNLLAAQAGAEVPMSTSTLSRGTTVTLACTASFLSINGVNGSVAAETAKAFGALGTIPASTWGLIAVERIANATTSFVSAAANYTTGYATEALAIAAAPAITADKVRIGYITVLASASTWVAGTDALAGGTGGTPATTTNYYSAVGAGDILMFTNALQVGNKAGTVVTTTAG